jgi:hypothetical protein
MSRSNRCGFATEVRAVVGLATGAALNFETLCSRRGRASNQPVELQRLPNEFLYTVVLILGEFDIAVAFALLARTLRRGP